MSFSEEDIARYVFQLGLKIHKNLGPGLLEKTYEACLSYELEKAGLTVEKQKALPLVYEQVKLELGYRIDLYVEQKFVVEVKAVEALNDTHLAQVLTYLKLSNARLGMLINFNTALFKDGVRRVINSRGSG